MKRYLGLAVGLGLLLIVLSVTNAGPALAQTFKPVMSFITNDTAHPVPVVGTVDARDVDGVGARNVVNVSVNVNMGGGSGTCANAVVVPAGKRLVIEHLSAGVLATAPAKPVSIGIIQAGSTHFLVQAPINNSTPVSSISTNYNFGVASEHMHVYSDVNITACVGLTSATSDDVRVEINGYLTDRY